MDHPEADPRECCARLLFEEATLQAQAYASAESYEETAQLIVQEWNAWKEVCERTGLNHEAFWWEFFCGEKSENALN